MDVEKEARRLKVIYQAAADNLAATLQAVDPAEFTGAVAVRIRDRVDSLIASLNRSARAWAKKALAAAYRAEQTVTRNRLLILGKKKTARLPAGRHERAEKKLIKQTLKDLYKANATFTEISDQYIGMLAEARRGIEQLHAFTGAEEAEIGKMAAEAVRDGLARQTLKNQIRDFLAEKLKGKAFIVINGRNYQAGKYAELVARVQLREAATEATLNSAKEYDHDLVEIPAKGGSCDICQEIEGQVYSISGNDPEYPALTEENRPPIHPRCVLPGTQCISPSGFVAGSRATFRGEAIELTFADGARLSVTPNHMLLTPCGFAAATLLREGDDVFYCPDFERIISRDPDTDQVPALVENIFGALTKSNGMTTRSVPGASEYFHGDGRFCDGDVDIVGPYGLLRDARKALTTKQMNKPDLGRAEVGYFGFLGLGDLAAELERLALTSDGSVGGFRTSSPFFWRRATCGNPRGLAGTPFFDSELWKHKFQPSVDNLVRDSEPLGDLAFQHSGLIQAQKLVRVNRFLYHGFVYDLQTPTSLYLGNGIVSSNCRHYVRVVSRSTLKFKEAL
jgi:hypothetical protein